jgi:hypothetical protein
VTGAAAVAALIVRTLPKIIRARSIAKTAKQACDNPQAERVLRVLMGPEYLEREIPATDALGFVIGKAPDAALDTTEASLSHTEVSKAPGDVLTAVPDLAA